MQIDAPRCLAVGFGNSWMLLWGATAIVPIVVHLWHRRQHHVEPWAAMEFLVTAIRRRSRRLRFEQLALLTTRVLLLLLLAFTMAVPFRSDANRPGASFRQPRHRILILDASYSMTAMGPVRTAFDTAKREAARMIENSRDGDGFSIIWMGEPMRTVVGPPVFDRVAAASVLRQLQPGFSGANLSESLLRVRESIAQCRREYPQLNTHEVIWFSDLMSNTWGQLESTEVKREISQIADHATLTVFDVGSSLTPNLAVTDLRSVAGVVTAGEVATIQAVVQNYTTVAKDRMRLEFHVDGKPVDQQEILPANGATQEITFQHAFADAGEHSVAVRLMGDPLEIDNWRFLSLPVLPSLRVLCVNGRPGASRYLRTALEPDRRQARLIDVDVVASEDLREVNLRPYHAILLSNVTGFDSHQVRLLSDYLSDGGGVVFFLGDRVRQSRYADLEQSDIFPVRLSSAVTAGNYRFDPRSHDHPIVRPFDGQYRNSLVTTPIWRYFQVELKANAEPALWFDTGDIAIAESTPARGRAIVVATAASDGRMDRSQDPMPWTAWPIWPSFPPCVIRLVDRAIDGRFENRTVLVGKPLEGYVSGTDLDDVVIRPDDPIVVPVEPSTGRWTFAETWEPRLLRCQIGDREQLCAVNVDTRESQPDRMDPRLIPKVIQLAGGDAGPAKDAHDRESPRQTLLPWCFAGLVLLLVAESSLGWGFGRVS